MRLLQTLNPRSHIAAAIGWAVFLIVTLAALMAANLAATEAEQRARADAEGLLAEFATQVRDALSMSLETRRSVLEATAVQIVAAGDRRPLGVAGTLDMVRTRFPEFTWLGVASASGCVTTGTDGLGLGDDVTRTLWFQQGRLHPYVGEGRTISALDTTAPANAEAHRLLDMAVPLNPWMPEDGGVIAARLSWSWMEAVLSSIQAAFNTRRQIDLLLVGRDGTVLAGPGAWRGRHLDAASDITEGGHYVVGKRTQLRLADNLGLGWTAIIRQSAESALEPVRTLRRTVFLIVFLAGLISAAAAMLATRVLTRRLSTLAVAAETVQRGEQRMLVPPAGSDEVSRIGATLSHLVEHLQAEKQALLALNAELDARVTERTLRIERMADEARHAAVTRERLRIARDLHDTLAHSLMALLTQVRLVRKLHQRMDDGELDAELTHAEQVAATGLAGARAAIAQMRDNSVIDLGLGQALTDLVRRFGQRTGVSASLDCDTSCATWADDRAATLFRIVEEALRNVERHAQSTTVCVTLHHDSNGNTHAASSACDSPIRVVVAVVDDGIGFDPALPRPGHYGLRGMREQAALIDAYLDIHSGPGEGTRVRVVLDC
ncbi:MAG: hypothetical protein CFE40_02575 [Burkholderiales bacterium PBB1]|nr:MAG: hypothetical protein CFE40_02575 [Burkholderiales bacterium PBB1]